MYKKRKRRHNLLAEVYHAPTSHNRRVDLSGLVAKAPGKLEVRSVIHLRADHVVDASAAGVAVGGNADLAPDVVATAQRLRDSNGVSRSAVVLEREAVVGVGGVALAEAECAGRAFVGSLAVDAQLKGERAGGVS